MRIVGLIALALLGFTPAGPVDQERLEQRGDFVEPLSAIVFPERLEAWERTKILKYPEPGGHSVSYEVRLDGHLVTATAYVYPQAPPWLPNLEEHFHATLTELRGLGGEVALERPMPIRRNDQSIDRRMATLVFRNGLGPSREPSIELVMLARIGPYWLKWRVTAPPAAADKVSSPFTALETALLPKPSR